MAFQLTSHQITSIESWWERHKQIFQHLEGTTDDMLISIHEAFGASIGMGCPCCSVADPLLIPAFTTIRDCDDQAEAEEQEVALDAIFLRLLVK